jgi:hypothetical protein
MNGSRDNGLHPIGSQFSEKLQTRISQRDGPKITDKFRRIVLGNKSDERSIDALKRDMPMMEILTEINKISLNNLPTLFEKKAIKTIRARSSIWLHVLDNIRDFFFRERLH